MIISPEGDRFIGESEGKDNTAINVDKFRQLSSNIQEDAQRSEINTPAIGILFGNGYRLTQPEKRAEQFTEKCINLAQKFNHILIRTSDLFHAAKLIKDHKDDTLAESCRNAIKNSCGKIVEFPLKNSDQILLNETGES